MNNGKTEIIYEGLGFRDEAAYGGALRSSAKRTGA